MWPQKMNATSGSHWSAELLVPQSECGHGFREPTPHGGRANQPGWRATPQKEPGPQDSPAEKFTPTALLTHLCAVNGGEKMKSRSCLICCPSDLCITTAWSLSYWRPMCKELCLAHSKLSLNVSYQLSKVKGLVFENRGHCTPPKTVSFPSWARALPPAQRLKGRATCWEHVFGQHCKVPYKSKSCFPHSPMSKAILNLKLGFKKIGFGVNLANNFPFLDTCSSDSLTLVAPQNTAQWEK